LGQLPSRIYLPSFNDSACNGMAVLVEILQVPLLPFYSCKNG